MRFSIFLFILLLATPALADSMRCGSKLVSTGDSKVKVKLRCGEPFHREVVGEETVGETEKKTVVELDSGRIEVTEETVTGEKRVIVERWHYHFGKSRFMRILTFEGDELVDIEIGDKP